jgi:hypothetical protein
LIQKPQQRFDGFQIVRDRIDADHRIAAAVRQSINDAGSNSLGIVGGMIGLQPRREPPREAQGITEARDHPDLGGYCHQILQSHDLRHRRGHFGCQPWRERRQNLASSLLAE